MPLFDYSSSGLLTESNPLAQITLLVLLAIDEPGFELIAEVADDGVHQRLQIQDTSL